MQSRFGWILRRVRVERAVKQLRLAAHLQITQNYLSQIELGDRPPLDPDRIRSAAAFLGCDPEPLIIAAACDRGAFPGLPADAADPDRCEAAYGLTDGWRTLTPDQIRRVLEVIGRRKGGG